MDWLSITQPIAKPSSRVSRAFTQVLAKAYLLVASQRSFAARLQNPTPT